jgi:transcriptional regulator with XRE-family HTH domain
MDMLAVIKERMEALGLEQKDLAAGAKVTESYISQLLTRKKAPPAPERTDIYSKMEKSLKLPSGRLSKLAELQRKEEVKRRLMDPPSPLFKEVRKLVLRKCTPEKADQVRAIFEKQPFGEVERLVTQKLLDVVKALAKEELANDNWLHLFARVTGRSYEEVRVDILEFLDTDVFHVSDENCVFFLDPLIDSWDIDFANFGIEVVLNRRLGPGPPKRFGFVERDVEPAHSVEPGLEAFLRDRSLSEGVTDEEVAFLERLRFDALERRPTPMYFYREVQSLRDPLHFRGRPNDRRGRASTARPRARLKRRRRKATV